MPLAFFKTEKTPQQIVQNLRSALSQLCDYNKETVGNKKLEKINEDVTKYLLAAKQSLMGTPEQEPQPEVIVQLSSELCNGSVIQLLLRSLALLDFEVQDKHCVKTKQYYKLLDFENKKCTSQILSNLLKRQIGQRYPTVDYILNDSNIEILDTLILGYETTDIALHTGMVLRECIKHSSLATKILDNKLLYNFFNYVECSSFDVATDAFNTFKDLLTVHRDIAAPFLEKNYDKFFSHYKKILTSENYVTKRQSLKLLGELLLDRHNYFTMEKYIGSAENLKLMMTMLVDNSRSIAFEAFHVFKIFVAKPQKTKEVLDILLKNKEKLMDFLSKFQSDRKDEEQFHEERSYIIKQIKALQRPSSPTNENTATDIS